MIGDIENTTPDGPDGDIIEAEVIEDTEITDVAIRTEPAERKIHKFRRWLLKTGLVLAVLGLLVYLIAALGYRLGIFGVGTSLMTLSFMAGPIIFLIGLVVSLISLLLSWYVTPRRGILLSLIALAIPLGGLLKTFSTYNTASSLPEIHDITTNPEDVPEFSQAIVDSWAETGATNSLGYYEKKDMRENKLVSVLQSNAYPDIDTVRRTDSPAVVYGEAKKLIGSKGWEVVTEDDENWVIEATDTSFWYGFKDDVRIRIRQSINGGSIIDMRSISRVGRSDLGVNAERLRELISELKGD